VSARCISRREPADDDVANIVAGHDGAGVFAATQAAAEGKEWTVEQSRGALDVPSPFAQSHRSIFSRTPNDAASRAKPAQGSSRLINSRACQFAERIQSTYLPR